MKKISPHLLKKFYHKKCSPEEAREVIEWFQDPQNKEELERLLQSRWDSGAEIIDTDLNKIYSGILEEIAADKVKTKRRPLSASGIYLGIAAAILILLISTVTIFYFNQNEETYVSQNLIIKSTHRGERLTTRLPDGTVVILNSESQISYPENFDGEERNVNLIGEAYFTVAKNIYKPFIVKSGPVQTMAVGTAFNINAGVGDEEIVVSLAEGKVLVNSVFPKQEDQKGYYLQPGDEIKYSTRGDYLEKRRFDFRSTMGWKDGILVFDEDDVDELKQKIEKWYGVEVFYKNRPNRNWKFTSEYKNENLENVLEGLKYSKNINYVIKNDSVEITFSALK